MQAEVEEIKSLLRSLHGIHWLPGNQKSWEKKKAVELLEYYMLATCNRKQNSDDWKNVSFTGWSPSSYYIYCSLVIVSRI